jgi:hypothetical protein
VIAFAVVLYLPAGGPREFYDATIGYQLGRSSPFSLWSQHPGLGWLQTAIKAGAGALALGLAVFPRRRDTVALAALGAAVLIATSLPAVHWFYFYVAWFAPGLLVALFAEYARGEQSAHRAPPGSRTG